MCVCVLPQLHATDSRLVTLESQREQLQGSFGEIDSACAALRDRETQLQAEISRALQDKYKLLLATSRYVCVYVYVCVCVCVCVRIVCALCAC